MQALLQSLLNPQPTYPNLLAAIVIFHNYNYKFFEKHISHQLLNYMTPDPERYHHHNPMIMIVMMMRLVRWDLGRRRLSKATLAVPVLRRKHDND